MSNILALDASSDACSVAFSLDGTLLEDFRLIPRLHAQQIMPMVDGLLRDAGVKLADLDGIAFGRGPGSFTGLRICAGVAQGLAFGADLPLIPVSTLAAMALRAHREQGAERIAAALDARMGELYWATYRIVDGWPCLMAPEQVAPPASIALPELSPAGSQPDADTQQDTSVPELTTSDWVGVGPGWNYRAELDASLVAQMVNIDASMLPHAADMAALAVQMQQHGAGVEAAEGIPVYLRDEVAWKKNP